MRCSLTEKRCQKELPDIYKSVSSHYLHFSDCDKASEDVLEYIAKQGIKGEPKSPSSFRSEMEAKLGDYFSGKPFAPSEVCCGIRLAVERLSYERLAADDKPGFLKKLIQGPRTGSVMRVSMELRCQRHFTCWAPYTTAACISLSEGQAKQSSSKRELRE